MAYDLSLLTREAQAAFLKEHKLFPGKRDLDLNHNRQLDEDELPGLLSKMNAKSIEELYQTSGRGEEETNAENTNFLKEWLIASAPKGVIPAGVDIRVSCPKKLSNEYMNLLNDVRRDIYQARTVEMFDLLSKDEEFVKNKVAQMRISDEDKEKIIKLKQLQMQYYKVEVSYNDETINILNMQEDDKEKLANISPKFADYIENIMPQLKHNTEYFGQEYLKANCLADAGKTSKSFIKVLLPILGASAGITIATEGKDLLVKKGFTFDKATKRFRFDKAVAEANKLERLKEIKTLSKQKLGFVNPIKFFKDSVKSGAKGGKWGKIAFVLGTLITAAAGSWDDCAGSLKDYHQDANNFGEKKARRIMAGAITTGIATSVAVAPMFMNNIEIAKAKKERIKNWHAKFEGEANIKNKARAKQLLKAIRKDTGSFWNRAKQFFKSTRFKSGSRQALVLAGFGILLASCSSGSSHYSMLATTRTLHKNGKDLVDKNIIDKEESTLKSTKDNLLAYDAYRGKAKGIWWNKDCPVTADPVIGATFGALGLLTSPLPFVAPLAFQLQGCSETLTASIFQNNGDNNRVKRIQEEQVALVESAQKS